MAAKKQTTIHLDDEDRIALGELRKLTGLGMAAAIRLAIREALAARKQRGER